jgi:hypothetical protein
MDKGFANEVTDSFSLFRKIEDMVAAIPLSECVAPAMDVPCGSVVIGSATEKIKRTYTLFMQLEKKKALGAIGAEELFRRGVHTAMSYEIGESFNCWGALIGIDRNWQIYAAVPKKTASTH